MTTLTSSLDDTRAKRGAGGEVDENIVFQVDDKAKLKDLDASMQADASMHTLDAWETRMRLRRAKEVREALHVWWSVVLRTLSSKILMGLPDEWGNEHPFATIMA